VFLQLLSVIVLFDALRRIRKALKDRKDLLVNETNMALHLMSFSVYLIQSLEYNVAE
jgi:S-adenosylhomocysteine hydrolase